VDSTLWTVLGIGFVACEGTLKRLATFKWSASRAKPCWKPGVFCADTEEVSLNWFRFSGRMFPG